MTELTSILPAAVPCAVAYRDRLGEARSHKARGGIVVGCVGACVPSEIIHSLGAMPVLIAPEEPHPTPTADRLIERTEPWPLRSIAEMALNGALEFLDLLVIARAEEWLYYNLKEAVRLGEAPRTPPLHMYDLIQNQSPAIASYNAVQTAMLMDRLARVVRSVNRGDLLASVATYNRKRELLAQLMSQRDSCALPGTLAMQVIGAGYFVPVEAYCEQLERLLSSLEPAASRAPRVLVATSEPLYHLELHAAIEEAGGFVVAEDTWWGSRAAAPGIETTDDVIAQIREHYVRHVQGEDVQPREARTDWLRARLARGDIDVLIFYVPPADKRFGWDYPQMREAATRNGVRSCLLRADVLSDSGRAAIVKELQTALAACGTREVQA